jgi:hypothetical protein
VKILYAAFAFALVGTATPAAAQFTAAVVPPKPPVKVDTVAHRDSLERIQMTIAQRTMDMKAWVDSAARALAATPAAVPADSAAIANAPSHPAAVTESSAGEVESRAKADTTFHNGARAPETATQLPLLALIGAGALLVGVALLRR